MSFHQSSAHYRKLIKERYNREPIEYAELGKQEYEDLEYVRSLMYEDGAMNALGPTTKEMHALTMKKIFAPTNKEVMRIKAAMEKLNK